MSEVLWSRHHIFIWGSVYFKEWFNLVTQNSASLPEPYILDAMHDQNIKTCYSYNM